MRSAMENSPPRRGDVAHPPRWRGWHSGVMSPSRPARSRPWRDPLALSFAAHRGLLLLRLRWHERTTRRLEPSDGSLVDPPPV